MPNASGRRATVRLLAACTNACVFCGQRGDAQEPLDDASLERALTAAREASDELTFTGGEPTAYPGLARAVSRARALGFARVGIESHARTLGDAALAARLADAGLTDVHASLHGPTPEAHDYHTGSRGSFAQSIAGIGAARARGLVVVATTVLTRSNFRVLGAMPRLLQARGVSAWRVAVVHAAGDALVAFDRVVPRLGLALPFALHALAGARATRLPAWLAGAPLCMLGPMASVALSSSPRAYAPACDACPARTSCPGVDPQYLARFHGDELSARATAPAAPEFTAGEAALARMFVEPGVLVRDRSSEPAASPRRVALPIARGAA